MAPSTADRFSTISIEGAILPPDLLKRVAGNDKDVEGLAPADYALVGEKLNEAISRSWNKVRALWAGFRDAIAKTSETDDGAKVTREKWLLPLFKELDYGLLAPAKPFIIEEKAYAISHAWEHTPIHMIGFRRGLDERYQAAADHPKMTPHGLVQEFLNRSKGHLWAFVSNGLRLRILRDSLALTRQAFVEFDLEAMLRDEVYPDFVLFWMLCHATRVRSERPEDCYLEKWSKAAQAQGTRALDHLRNGVEKAIVTLGRGFITHPANKSLRTALEGTGLSKEDYYRQLLRLVYRLIFLFVAEDRDILLPSSAALEARGRYRRFYSTQRLRELARVVRGTPHGDLWQSLCVVMEKLGQDEGCPELGLPALGSFLWSDTALAGLRGCCISNRDLLDAIRALTFTDGKGLRRSVDYRNLGAEELGSIYESLLELRPTQVNTREGVFELVSASGNERKTTGSYYTPTNLVTCLLDSALDPVLDVAAKKPEPQKAILALKVVDPACGSGHFLIAAAHRIAKRLAVVRTGNEEPSPPDVRTALRDVIGHCVYGVDVNEMAVELCKVSLWMEALEPGKPLSFLDSKICHGNALIGATPALVAKGIPDEAFEAIEGDDKTVVSSLRRDNRAQRSGQGKLFGGECVVASTEGLTNAALALEAVLDETIEGVHRKERAWADLRKSEAFQHAKLIADAWCAAFVWRKTNTNFAITEDLFRRLAADAKAATPKMAAEVGRLTECFAFFHWHLTFPEVFAGNGPEADKQDWKGGFDVVLGNPPWEQAELKEKEFFAVRRPDIANADNADKRKKLIAKLPQEDPTLWDEFVAASTQAEAERHFVSNSGRFPLCGKGRVNTYALFAEWNRALLAGSGHAGCIVPSAIATADTAKDFFQEVTTSQSLHSLLSFAEIRAFFPATQSREPFSLVTMVGSGLRASEATYAFGLWDVADLAVPGRRFTLDSSDITLLNPNTKTCPILRTRRDADIARKIYRRIPVLVHQAEPKENPWQVKMKQGLFNMASDSRIFRDRSELEKEGWKLDGNVFVKGKEMYLPLYEAKMVHHFDHRFGTYEGQTQAQANQGILPRPTPEQKGDPDFVVQPWFWVPAIEVSKAIADWDRGWQLGWRRIVRNTDERTLIASLLPNCAVGDSEFLLMSNEEPALVAALAGCLSSLMIDYLARQKLGGTNLNFFTIRQLPVVPPDRFRTVVPYLDPKLPAFKWFAERVLELVYVSGDMNGFARDCGYTGKPFKWDEARRVRVRAELDAAFFHLYGLDRADVEFILDAPAPGETFRVLKENEVKKFGEYRTKRMVLEQYDAMTARMPNNTATPKASVTAG